MKVKRLKVGVRSLDEGLQEFGSTLKAIQSGKVLTKRTGVYFVSVEAMRQVLTPSRLTLLHLIRARRPRSIAALAKLLGRNFKNVHADLKLLADLGLVHLEPGAHLRDSVTPTVPYERIQFEIAV
jgi:predicted transcriptional regulator